MKLQYAIHKDLSVTADEIQKAIEECREIPGVEMDIYADGWIIAEPTGMKVNPWKRNTNDYNIEILE